MKATTLTELMEANRGAARSITYLEGEHETRSVSYAELHARALGILARLQRLGARPGDKLILLLNGNEPFIDAFWAAILGGIIPVPVAPGISDEHRHKLLRIARRLGSPYLYTEQRLLERLGEFAHAHGLGRDFELLRARAFLIETLENIGTPGEPYAAQPQDTAFIQFSSGSTSEPKGVVLTHANLLANIRGATEVAGFDEHDVSLSWMPLTHDMGLIGMHLVMFANRAHAHLMPTELFVRRPLLWLTFASRVRASVLCSPNFGYRHYLKVLGERAPGPLDLSSVRLLFNGAEPISVELCEQFLARLEPAGLSHNAMYPVYGLAEASLAVSFPRRGAPLHSVCFDRSRLGVGAAPVAVGVHDPQALQLVSVGRPIPYCELRIADDEDRPLPDGHVGHVLIRGDNVTRGYFEAPEANAAAFSADGWLRTGDLGLVHEGELYITGRHKDILFVAGQNYYPHDLEHMLEGLEGLELGKVVVAGARRARPVDELLVFVLHRSAPAELAPLARRIAARLSQQAGLEVDEVVPVPRIPKTTSGKIQRRLLVEQYLQGVFDAPLEELARARASEPPPPPRGAQIVQRLLEICEAELEGHSVAPDQSLFDIGASSLKLIAIHERIERTWPGVVDVTDIFEHPSVNELAEFIGRKLQPAARAPVTSAG